MRLAIMILRNLHTLVQSGLPLAVGCRRLAAHAAQPAASHWSALADELEIGTPLSRAIRHQSLHRSDWITDALAAGEASGTVDQMLEFVADELEYHAEWKQKFIIRMLYPAVLLHLTALLPAVPIALNHGIFWGAAWLLSFLSCLYIPTGCIVLLLRAGRRSPRLRQFGEKLILRIPLIGTVLRSNCSARFYRMLAALAMASTRWEYAVTSSAAASGSALLQAAAQREFSALQHGEELTATLGRFHYFTSKDLEELFTAEISGTLPERLEHLAVRSRQTASEKLNRWSAVLTGVAYAAAIAGVLLTTLSILGPIYYQVYELLHD